MDKKGLELSINFIVILILGIIIFGMGLSFLAMINKTSDEITQDINRETQAELEKILDDGSKVAFPENTLEVKPGDSVTFAIGILNNIGQQGQFQISAYPGVAYTESKTMLQPIPAQNILSPSQGSNIIIENNEHIGKRILVQIPGNFQRGTYVINVEVLCVDPAPPICPVGPYDGFIHKIYLKVN